MTALRQHRRIAGISLLLAALTAAAGPIKGPCGEQQAGCRRLSTPEVERLDATIARALAALPVLTPVKQAMATSTEGIGAGRRAAWWEWSVMTAAERRSKGLCVGGETGCFPDNVKVGRNYLFPSPDSPFPVPSPALLELFASPAPFCAAKEIRGRTIIEESDTRLVYEFFGHGQGARVGLVLGPRRCESPPDKAIGPAAGALAPVQALTVEFRDISGGSLERPRQLLAGVSEARLQALLEGRPDSAALPPPQTIDRGPMVSAKVTPGQMAALEAMRERNQAMASQVPTEADIQRQQQAARARLAAAEEQGRQAKAQGQAQIERQSRCTVPTAAQLGVKPYPGVRCGPGDPRRLYSTDSLEQVLAFYSRELGRPPDDARGNYWFLAQRNGRPTSTLIVQRGALPGERRRPAVIIDVTGWKGAP